MKIPLSIRQIYESQLDINRSLKEAVDRRIYSIKQQRWHYESRIKELDSFALKIETGRFPDASKLEDFFACTLVVANAREIETAEQLVRDNFDLHNRKPSNDEWTHKSADSFQFDDLRLYMTLKQDPTLPPSELTGILFEVQIKTFLQHAWSIATHDLIYKTHDANWSKERLAYQIKAMLEHAEISIQEAETLSDSAILKKEDRLTKSTRKSLAMLKSHWNTEELPVDVRRLARNVSDLLDGLGIELRRLEEILTIEKQASGGSLPLNLSPYAIIVQSLLRHEKIKMQQLLASEKAKIKIVFPSEIEFPGDIERNTCCNAIFIGKAAL